MPRAFRLSAVLAALAMGLPAHAQLDGKPPDSSLRQPDALLDGSAHERKMQGAALAGITWGVGPGVGVRVTLPLLKDGFLPEINESIEIDGGGNFAFASFGGASLILIAVEPRWTFHMTPQLDLYAKIGLGWAIFLGPSLASPFQVPAGVGAIYRLLPALSLRLEAGNLGLAAGVGIEF